jgi:ABC-type Fe3+/spermidine/putrescine transport system ATPase subunit
LLSLTSISKSYNGTPAVQDVSLDIGQGEFFCLLGASGCGKTTLLRIIAGFEKPCNGTITLNGKDITSLPPNKRDVNTVFQNYALFPNLDVADNIAYGLRVRKMNDTMITQKLSRVVAVTGLEGLEKRMPASLSGGQQQRVALARALVNEPSLLLLDEPLSALDKKIAEQTRLELWNIQRQVGITFVYVTHNQTEALSMADRVAMMCKGKLEQCATPREIYERPGTINVADFVGSMNFLQGKVLESTPSHCSVHLDGLGVVELATPSGPHSGQVRFGIRPERLRLSLLDPQPYENGLHGILERKVFMGESTSYIVRLDNGCKLDVRLPNYLPQATSEFFDIEVPLRVIWSKTSGQVFDV